MTKLEDESDQWNQCIKLSVEQSNKGKREVDDELEKLVGGKKQKRDEVIENQKKEAKVHCYYTRKSKVAATTGNNEPTATEPKAESSFEHENSSSDKDVTTSSKKVVAAGKKVESNEVSDPDFDSRTAEDNVVTASMKLHAASAGDNVMPAKKVELSDGSSSDNGSNKDDVQKTDVSPSSKKLPVFVVSQMEKIEHNDNSYNEPSFDEDNLSEEKETEDKPSKASHRNVTDELMVDPDSKQETIKEAPEMEATPKEQNDILKKIFVANLSQRVEKADLVNLLGNCGEIVNVRFGLDRDGRFKGFGHVEFATKEAAQKALKLNGNELFRRSIRIEMAREKFAYISNSSNWMDSTKGYTSLVEDERKWSTTWKERNATSKTLFVGNLSFSVEKTDLEILFKDCGEIVDVRFATDSEGRFKGFGHVEFATIEAAQNALKFNGTELLRRSIKLDLAPERFVCSKPLTVFVKGFDTSLREDEIETSLEEHFGSCGLISNISIAKDYGTGCTKGFAWLDFKDTDGFNKALQLDGTEIGGYTLVVVEGKARRHNHGGRGGGGGRFGGWHGGDGWGRERSDGSSWWC